jgi:hypothetical protein
MSWQRLANGDLPVFKKTALRYAQEMVEERIKMRESEADFLG